MTFQGFTSRHGKPGYRCGTYHRGGHCKCYPNQIHEAPLIAVLVDKIRSRYTTAASLSRLRKALFQELKRTQSKSTDLAPLRQELEKLERKISAGEDAVFEAPPELRTGLYRKLQDLTSRRDALKAELETLTRHEKQVAKQDDTKLIERSLDALRELGESLAAAPPEEASQLLRSIVSRVVLHYEHTETPTGRKRHTLTHGEILVRPDLGAGEDADGSTLMQQMPSDLSLGTRLRFPTLSPVRDD